MKVYIQKKIKNIWRTVLAVDSTNSSSAFDHLCRQYCQDKFRISMNETDNMPAKPVGLSRDEALNKLCDIQLVDLTWKQGKEAFKKIVNIVCEVHKRYNRPLGV